MSEDPHQRKTQIAYDAVASDYAALLREELTARPIDRAISDCTAHRTASAE